MKNSLFSLLIMNLAGLALLILASVHFAPPLFGWMIIAAIVVVYAVSMERYRRMARHIEMEENMLAQVRRQGIEAAQGEGTVAQRIAKIQTLHAKGVSVDAQVLSEVLSAREMAGLGRSPGAIVLMLGLAGTFYGLMLSVDHAGGSLDVSSTHTLNAIHNIFQSMTGIFGTSFAGLIAALFLNSTHALLGNRKTAFTANMEEWTQFELIPAFSLKDDAEQRRSEELLHQLTSVVAEMQQGMHKQNEVALEELQKTMQQATSHLEESLRHTLQESAQGWNAGLQSSQQHLQQMGSELQQMVSEHVTQMHQDIEHSQKTWKDLSESWLSSQQQSQQQVLTSLADLQQAALQNLEKGSRDLAQEFSSALQQSTNHQVDEFQGKWNLFLEQGRDAMAKLDQVAEHIAQRSHEESRLLSEEVGQRIEQLSKEVQDSFGQLAQVSSQLMESQQAMIGGMQDRLQKEQEVSVQLQEGVGEASTLMRINQSEFQASLEMFHQGLEAVLEKVTGSSAEEESQRAFMDQLQATLEAFSERASEVLMENAVRTQEILLEVLEQNRTHGGEG